ncbi:MAG TPA: hypothetical protein VKR60_09635 [Candidatus Sulfotelmatobacter sp.]|nr:hypothetical protein [Candidatus Sulfotelmatobacter sp.]
MTFRSSAYSRVLKSIAITMLVAGLTAVQAQTSAAANRPAAVPADYVLTPFGYFHPSCVNHLAQEDVLRQDLKVIERKNGTTQPLVCNYPRFEADGTKTVGDLLPVGDGKSEPPFIGHSWIEYASIHDSYDYEEVSSRWTVPPNPSSNDGQTLYFFNGLEQYSGDVTIIQPVLGWNSDYGSAWGIASWNCCPGGTTNEASPQPVNPGDQIEGYSFSTCKAGTKKCPTWNVVTLDDENGNFSQLSATPNEGQTFNWAFGGVLEVYNITQCSDYPAKEGSGYSGAIGFHDHIVLNDSYVKITPAWTVTNVSGGLTPQCSYGGSVPKQVILNY